MDVDVGNFLLSLFVLVLLLALVLFLLLVTTLGTASLFGRLLVVLLFLFLLLLGLLLLRLSLASITALSCRSLSISLLLGSCSFLRSLCSICSFSLSLFLFSCHHFFVAFCPSTTISSLLTLLTRWSLNVNLKALLLVSAFLLLLLPCCRLGLRLSRSSTLCGLCVTKVEADLLLWLGLVLLL